MMRMYTGQTCSRTLIISVLSLSIPALLGCPKAPPEPTMGPVTLGSREVEDELPGWMTRGEEARLAAAEELIKTGNTIGALDVLRQMRQDGYNGPRVDLFQGMALQKDGVMSEAERMLLAAQKKLPKDGRPSAELCILYADLARLDEAIANCKRATEIDSNSPSAWNNLGFLLLAAERPDEALLAAEHALELDGGQTRFRNNLGMAQAAVGREEIAFRTLQSTMSKADAAFMVGLVVERFTGHDPARVWYEKALAFDPNHSQAREGLGPAPDADTTTVPDREDP